MEKTAILLETFSSFCNIFKVQLIQNRTKLCPRLTLHIEATVYLPIIMS